MNIHVPSGEGTSVAVSGQRLGESDEQTLYQLLLRTGVLADHGDHDWAIALIGLALRCDPSLLVLRFVDVLPGRDTPLDAAEICNALARMGHDCNAVHTAPSRLDPRLGPALVLSESPQLLTMRVGPTGKVEHTVFDCQTGAQNVLGADHPDMCRPQRILVFQRLGQAGRLDRASWARREGQSWFMNLLSRMRGTVALLMGIGFLLTATSMTVPIFIMLVYDQIVGQRAPDPFLAMAIGAVLVVLAEIQLRFIRARALSWLASRLDYLVGTALFEKLLALPPRVAEQVPIASHIARIKTFESVREFFSGPILVSALGVPATLFALTVIYALSGALVLVSPVTIFTYILIAPVLWRRVIIAIEEAAIEGSAAQRFTLETFQKLPSIQQDGLTGKWAEKFRTLSGTSTAAQYRLHMLGQNCEAIGNLVSGIAIILTLWFGTHMVRDGTLSVGALIGVTMLTWSTLFPFHSVLSLLPRFEQSRKSILQINAFMDTDLDEDQFEGNVPAPNLKCAVELAGVAVRYAKATGPIFAGLSLNARPGELVAIAGSNGAGKTSVMKLAAGLQAPMLGAVRFDGLDARQLNPRDLRRRIAYVPQRVALFEGTLATNLRLANRLAGDDAVWAALDFVGARQQVAALPDQLETRVVPGELGQSELLVQRPALARAILQTTQLILIDERPAAALRAGLDRDLKTMFARLNRQRTIFIATHRADFIRMADKAIALRPGLVPVVGGPDKILEVIE